MEHSELFRSYARDFIENIVCKIEIIDIMELDAVKDTVFIDRSRNEFIGNTDSSKNFNFDRQCSHYVQATKDANYFGALFMATEPKLDTMPEEWTPYCPSALQPEDISLWSCGTTTFDFTGVDDVYAKDEKVLENMW